MVIKNKKLNRSMQYCNQFVKKIIKMLPRNKLKMEKISIELHKHTQDIKTAPPYT